MQRKEELLSQLDVALRRKVQEKYMKQAKSQEMDPLSQEFYGGETERNKYSSKAQHKVNSNTNTNISKSPHVVSQKQTVNHAKSQNTIHSKVALSPHQLKSPKMQTERDVNNEPTSSIHLSGNAEQEYARLKARNHLLQKEMRELKMNLTQLQAQSKLLKREEGEYLKLKQENLSLGKEIQFLRAKNGSKKEGDVNIAVLQQQIKRIMLQLNLSFINKHNTSERFVNEALKGVSQGVAKLIEDKSKLASKLNNFDIENVLNKESNTAYRKEIDILRVQNQQLSELIEDNCSKIEELQRDLQTEGSEKRKLQFHYKEVCKQLDSMKREFKLTVEAGKHSKPKREYPAARSKEPMLTEQSIARAYSEQEIQTENQAAQPLFHELPSNHEDDFLEERNSLLHKINELNEHIDELESNSLRDNIQRNLLQEKIYKYQQYIKELQYKSQEIQKDLNNFMPQLQQIEEENRQLRQANSIKDQQIISKLTTINEMRNSQEQLEERLSINEMQFKKQVFQHELTRKEAERMRSNVSFLTQKERMLENELRSKQTQLDQLTSMQNSKQTSRQSELTNKLRESQLIANQKRNQMQAMIEEWNIKQKEYLQQITKLEEKSSASNTSKQQLNKFAQQFSSLKQTIQQNIANYHQSKDKIKKLLIQYGVKLQQAQDNLDKLDQTTDNIWEQYTKLQRSYNSLREQKEKTEFSYQNQALKNDQLVREIFSYKCDIQRLSFDSKNNGQLKDYFQQTTHEMKSKLQQLLIQNGSLQKEKAELIQKNNALENFKKEIEVKHAQVAHNWQQAGQQCEDLKKQLYRLSNDYHLLSQDYIVFKEEAQKNERQRLQQISLQVFDIERLARQSNEMKARIEQLTSLKESKVFRETEAGQKIMLLTEENRSLAKRYEMLQEQLMMKQANKEEDQYLNQLKNKQYCILLKKLLSDLMEAQELDHYSSFEQLLEIASDRAVQRKKQLRDHESQMRKTLKNQYEIQYTKEYPAKRYYIGTEISSSQEIMGVRNFGEDEIIELQSKIIDRPIVQGQQSPRSFKFSFSPYEEQKKQKRTQRLISCYNPASQGQSRVRDNQQTFKH